MSNTGTIDKLVWDKGFGFIKTENGESVFFHASSLWEGQNGYDVFDSLNEWDEVNFDITEWNDGKSKATNVEVA